MKFSDLKVYHILLILALVGLIVALIFLIKEEDDDSSGSTPDLGGNIVAVGFGFGSQTIVHGTDGNKWQDATGSKFSSGQGYGIAYGTSSDGSCLWVAVGSGTHDILYSKDGTSWQDTATGTSTFGYGSGSVGDGSGNGIAYGTSSDGTCLWVAVGQGTDHILYSKDGTYWQATATGISKFGDGDGSVGDGSGNGIAYGTSSDGTCLWVAVGVGTHNILYSKDGTSWQDTATGTSKFGTCITRGDGGYGIAYGTSSDGSCLWVAVGSGTHNILYSKDGISWQATATGTSKFGGPNERGYGIAYGTSSDGSCLWVAVGSGDHNILYSKDGISWQDTATGTSKFGGYGRGIAYGKDSTGSCLWVAVGPRTDPILYSNNGTHWAASTDTADLNEGYSVAFDHLLYGMSKDYYRPQ